MISLATEVDQERLFEVWEASVRATHAFLSEEDILTLSPAVRAELARPIPIHCTRDAEGRVSAFMVVEGDSLEGLFVAPAHRGAGVGRALLEHAIGALDARRVIVNEANPQAIGFYERMGFRVTSRSPMDGQGRPFPILHMALVTP